MELEHHHEANIMAKELFEENTRGSAGVGECDDKQEISIVWEQLLKNWILIAMRKLGPFSNKPWHRPP